MRYYGMNSGTISENPVKNADLSQSFEEFSQKPSALNAEGEENRTFNRPMGDEGLYMGQRAQNVRETEDFYEKPPAFVPDTKANMGASGGNENFFEGESVVYEYPPVGEKNESPCRSDDNFINCLCRHTGQYLYADMGGVKEKQGVLLEVGRNYIVLKESLNHVVCPVSSIKSVTFYNQK